MTAVRLHTARLHTARLHTARLHRVRIAPLGLAGSLVVPEGATAIVVFAHEHAGTRASPGDLAVAGALQDLGFGTLLCDLLTPGEADLAASSVGTALLTARLLATTRWLGLEHGAQVESIGYLGSGIAAAACLVAATLEGSPVTAVVSYGGRPDLACASSTRMEVPTLFVVGAADTAGVQLHRAALRRIPCQKRLALVKGAGPCFEEPGALLEVARLAGGWFLRHLDRRAGGRAPHAIAARGWTPLRSA